MKSKPEMRPNRPSSTTDQASSSPEPNENNSVVAIGASAGGIEAVTDLISHLPPNTGMSFVLIQHLDPKHHSMLTELLSRKTAMRVQEVSDGMHTEPNHVYVIPPNTRMSISDHTLHLAPREELHGMHMPVDYFMRSLAEQHAHRAIGVILSGSGSDGTLGMAEIQAHGGVTFAQDETSAKYSGMPRSAAAAGYVDYVLPPEGIGAELARIARHPYVVRGPKTVPAGAALAPNAGLGTIFQLLRRTTGVDFAQYRQTTVLRRMQRRMVVHKLDKLEEYVRYVQGDPVEIRALYQDLLINVTSFFRVPHTFDALQTKVFPAIIKKRLPDHGIRIWTPGCASGEETYSVAIALLEVLGDKASQIPIQFFGSDVNESSIAKARSGIYPENIRADVSAGRLRKFFTEVPGGYRVSKSIRDMCIFAQHNVLNDPPFSQMDLICCRNVLIYLEQVLQSKVISLFHYALRPGGFLMLGGSEGVGTSSNLFAVEERTQKIFSKKATAARQVITFALNSPEERNEYGPVRVPAKQHDSNWNYSEAQKEFDRRLFMQYAPATAFINEDMEIVHTRGNVSRYLKLAPGRASLNLMKMVREGLQLELRSAVGRAKKENKAIEKRNLQIKNGPSDSPGSTDSACFVNVNIVPMTLGNLKELYFMVVFEDAAPIAPQKGTKGKIKGQEAEVASGRVAKLEQELAATKEYLQSVIETQEALNEELQSANEEILSSNEELQSTNEELGTAKEELQSTNEELSTVNDELRSRNLEITQVNNDLTNLLSSTDIAVIMIGSDLTIRRFTPKAQRFLGLIPGDIGRSFFHISPTIEIAGLHSMVQQVMSDLKTWEKELTDRAGVHYQLKVLPYRTLDNKIEGAVITIVDIAPARL